MPGGEAPDPGGTGVVPWRKTATGVAMCGFLLVAGFYLATEHTAHLFGALPFLLILACPLMHLFHLSWARRAWARRRTAWCASSRSAPCGRCRVGR